MGYLLYYLAWFALSVLVANPRLLLGFLLILVLTPVLPDPGRALARVKRAANLRRTISLNRADAVARRDLAALYVEGFRPARALPLLDEALSRSPNDAELHLLRGRALVRIGRNDEAIAALGHAVELDASVGFGAPYRHAGDAHYADGHFEEAAEAYEQYVADHSSDVESMRRLARSLEAIGRKDDARARRAEARRTYAELPSYLRRSQLGAYLRLLVDGAFA